MTNIEQLDTKVSLLKEKAISIICACRIGGMDNNQFKATLEFNIDSLLDQAVQARNEEVVKEIKKRLKDRLMNYDSKDGYSTLYDSIIENLCEDIDHNLLTNLISPGRK